MNNRKLKKNIKAVCGDIAAECLLTATFMENADEKLLVEAIKKAAALQEHSLMKVNIAFTQTPKEFANRGEYRKARREYFKKAFTSLDENFMKEATSIIADLNKAIPKTKKD